MCYVLAFELAFLFAGTNGASIQCCGPENENRLLPILTLNRFRLSPLLNVSSVGMFHEYTVLEHWNNKSMMCKIICLNGTVLTSYSSLRQSLQSSLRQSLYSFTKV